LIPKRFTVPKIPLKEQSRITAASSVSVPLRFEQIISIMQIMWLCQHACLLTSWCRVLLEKLTGLQLVKNFPAFHGTRRFITALTSVRHLSLSWANPIQSNMLGYFMKFADYNMTRFLGIIFHKL